MAGTLYLCATPIGNLGDASARLRETLATADLVFAEDTRRTGRLLAALGLSAELRSYFVGNEAERSVELAAHLAAGRNVALVTDAGTPAVADPGVSAVLGARKVGADVRIIPGPSAVTSAIAISGFGGDRFVFDGFLPRKGRERSERLASISAESRPTVLFTTANRLTRDLEDLASHLGAQRAVCVTRELTKLYEEVWWGTLEEAVERWAGPDVKGELTLVVSGASRVEVGFDEAVEIARSELGGGSTRSAAARTAAEQTGHPRRQIYEALG